MPFRIKNTSVLAAILAVLILDSPDLDSQTRRIAVIPKGTTHLFWKSVESGARQAGKDFNVEVIWKGPLKETDRAQQIALVERFVNEGVSGICLAPLDYKALVRPVGLARERNIPVLIFDSGLDGEPGKDFISYVATDNKKGGILGGQCLAEKLGGKGKVVLLRFLVGSASTIQREEGFLQTMARFPGIEVLVNNRYGGATTGDSKTTAMNLLDKIRQADGIFCSNESSTFGMLLALRQSGLAGKIAFVGFDASPPLIEALRSGEIHALVSQDPVGMAYKAVQTMVEHLDGKSVVPAIETQVQLITRENLGDSKIKALLGTP